MNEECFIPEKFVILEKFGDYNVNYSASRHGNMSVNKNSVRGRFKFIWFVKNILKEMFLPQGYPSSVNNDYLGYQIWDMIQSFFNTMNGAFSTFVILKSVGVGSNEASALAATVTWIFKDISGMIGRIAFVWWRGFSLDSDCKKWRMATDCINDLAFCLELLLVFGPFKKRVGLVLCCSNIMKGVVTIAGGATRSAIIQHQAKRGNMADVAAKDGSQETCVNLLASFLALCILIWIENCLWSMWALFCIFTFIHLYANYKSLRNLKFKTLNSSRLILLVTDFLKFDCMGTLNRINRKDGVIFGFGVSDRKICNKKIYVGRSLEQIITDGKLEVNHFNNLQKLYGSFQYMIVPNRSSINIVLKENITEKEIIMGYFHALVYGIISKNMDSSKKYNKKYGDEFVNLAELCEDTGQIETHINTFVVKKWSEFYSQALKQGWILDHHNLPVDEWRIKWS